MNRPQSPQAQKKLAPNSSSTPKPSKIWLNLIFDIILPVIILNKLSPFMGERGPLYALLLALSLPLGHGLFDFYKENKLNWFSLLGLLNIIFTGGFALLKLEGTWFAVKEASFPGLIGLFVFLSSFSKKPFFIFFLNQEELFNRPLINARLEKLNQWPAFHNLMKRCSLLFSGTFFLSAVLNFYLAMNVFKGLPIHLSEVEKADLLNGQIAQMTWKGYVVIAFPLLGITSCLFYYCLKRLTQITQLKLGELLHGVQERRRA